MTGRTWLLAGAAAVTATATGAVVAMSGPQEPAPATREPAANTARVQRGTLATMVTRNGTLTYRARSDGSPYTAVNPAAGTYTELPDEGDTVGCGDVFYRVDEEPVLLLCGVVPAYRDLALGDAGRDVRQLNRNLRALGHGAEAGGVFTWRTQEALRELQRDRGFDATGALDLGDAVFLSGPARIARATAELGGRARPGAPVAQATSGTLEVQVELEPSQQEEVRVGDRARILLPGNTSVKGRVARLGRVARTAGEDDQAGTATISAYLTLDEPQKARGLDRAPVRVEITTAGVPGVLSVPVTAIVGRSGGGFAVEAVRDGGRREMVAVKLGLFDTANGRVGVEGELAEGDRVVVPAS